MEKTSTITPKFEDIKNDLSLLQQVLKNFNLATLEILEKQDRVNVLDYGSGDLKLSSVLSRGFNSNAQNNKKMKYFCYDPIYYDQNKLEEYKKTSRITLLQNDFVDLDITQNIKDAKKQKTDILISNFCFHHFLENLEPEDLKKEILNINPNKIIISEYNIDKNIPIEDFKIIFGKSQQEIEEVFSYNQNWETLKNIHTSYNIDFFIDLLDSLGYVIKVLEKSKTKFFIKADKCSNS